MALAPKARNRLLDRLRHAVEDAEVLAAGRAGSFVLFCNNPSALGVGTRAPGPAERPRRTVRGDGDAITRTADLCVSVAREPSVHDSFALLGKINGNPKYSEEQCDFIGSIDHRFARVSMPTSCNGSIWTRIYQIKALERRPITPPAGRCWPQSRDVAGRKRSFLPSYNGRVVPASAQREPVGVPQSPVGAAATVPCSFVAAGEARYSW